MSSVGKEGGGGGGKGRSYTFGYSVLGFLPCDNFWSHKIHSVIQGSGLKFLGPFKRHQSGSYLAKEAILCDKNEFNYRL